MADNIPQVHFNDGEGIDEDDFNRAQSLLDHKIHTRTTRYGSLCNVLGMGYVTGRGGDMTQYDPKFIGDTSALQIYTPDPRSFIYNEISVNGSGDFRIDYGPQLVMQANKVATTPGTPPEGFSTRSPLAYMMDDDELAFAGIARPSVNPRFDSVNLRLGHSVGNAVSRDFEDSSTRALSSTTPDKDQQRLLQQEYLQGSESASPVYPSPTSGYGRFITILRETGETSLDQDNVSLHAFPMKLKVETVYGVHAWFPTGFQQNATHVGAIEKNGAGGGDVVFMSSNMHEGSRLVGIGISMESFSIDIDNIYIQRMQGSSAGAVSRVNLLQLSANSTGDISTSGNGLTFIGLPELVDTDGNEIPTWGNGRTYGPLFSDKAQNPAQQMGEDRLCLSIQDAAWSGGESINYVQFYYLE